MAGSDALRCRVTGKPELMLAEVFVKRYACEIRPWERSPFLLLLLLEQQQKKKGDCAVIHD